VARRHRAGPWKSEGDARAGIDRWLLREGHAAGSLVAAQALRVNGYRTREAARRADITDELGVHCIAISGVYEIGAKQ